MSSIRDETTCENSIGADSDSRGLDDDAEDENAGGYNNAVLPGKDLSYGSRQERANPGSELENGREPSLLCLVGLGVEGIVVSHVWGTEGLVGRW